MSRWGVRIVFVWQGEEVHEYFTQLVALDFAEAPYLFGITPVRVLRARIVPWAEVGV